MNWYKKIAQNIYQQYVDLGDQAQMITITGTGQNENVNIPGTSININASELLEKAKMQIAPALIQNGVREIDTSPIADMGAQGLAISHEPGKIHIDVQKIFQNAKSALPPTVQFDGTEVDPDMVSHVVNQVATWLYSELIGTIAHESQHASDFSDVAQQRGEFTSVQEHPAEQFQQQVQQQYTQPFARNLPY